MEVKINNRGPGEVFRLILEPSGIQDCVQVFIAKVDYSTTPASTKVESGITVSAEELKAGMDSLIKACKKKEAK